ncbi:phosphotransferase family protein [Microbacterium sorbitolivorans]|uniref:Aminoglycoside phosphotransferase family protein n=1 Tax=Microbacterium sorbitolivorans TaxID=1867410 RepID=A0A367Y730_9MICO|nr:aminoglycoside phosphotransferase family protein [Microbacterium sorbitolivorans]RCK61637.1 aminoglycoside phosphotransferase family protein [Microbacterium sorbitolivorans]
MNWSGGVLDSAKAERVTRWIGESELVANLSWGLVDTVVLHVRSPVGDVIVKTAGPGNHHIGREIAAHRGGTEPLVAVGRTSRMLHTDGALNLLVLEYQTGVLVQGSGLELSADVHRQAGAMLRLMHSAAPAPGGEDYVRTILDRASRWLATEHRIAAELVRRSAEILKSASALPVRLVPTHGDWHTRNWLIDDGFVKAIDFGRFAYRAASSDLTRLAVKEWRGRPDLEHAFLDGYGEDPRDPELWRLELLGEAIGTAAWAYQVKDEKFEAQGHRKLSEALALF